MTGFSEDSSFVTSVKMTIAKSASAFLACVIVPFLQSHNRNQITQYDHPKRNMPEVRRKQPEQL
jgi:hypothetical protein